MSLLDKIFCWIKDIINWLLDFIGTILAWFFQLLPDSPFDAFDEMLVDNQVLKWINYFIPFGSALAILSSYLVAVGLYYLAMWGLKMIKLLGK